MQIRSRAPLRLGFAGGGTDLRSYSEQFGGSVFNATIGMYSYCTIIPTEDGKIRFLAPDRRQTVEIDATDRIEIEEPLILHKGVYNRIVREFNGGKPLSFVMSTSSDAPASVHFCTRKSLRSPFGRPANTVERTVGSALHGTTSMTSASASCSSVCTRRHL